MELGLSSPPSRRQRSPNLLNIHFKTEIKYIIILYYCKVLLFVMCGWLWNEKDLFLDDGARHFTFTFHEVID
jgi:hypothetical protein